MKATEIKLGCEVLVDKVPSWLRSERLGLLVNQASVDHSFESVSTLVRKAGGRLTCLFSPQHGLFAEKQANMIESSDGWDASSSVPIFSLYGRVRRPTPEMLGLIDVLVIDLQDVGTRVYTYGATVGLCIEAASRSGVKVVVLDRPNPIGGVNVEGNVLREDHRSFVGLYCIPMRHGLTLGELARYMAAKCELPCDLEVVPVRGWKRSRLFPETRLPWVFPSPNMPSWETALLYPGMVLLEGTNVSEGRGTTLPFQIFGAPFIDQHRLGEYLAGAKLEGVAFRPVCFEPTFDKWKGEACFGFQIHITDHRKIMPYRLGLTLLQGLLNLHGDRFCWLSPPYEYEWSKLPIDILLGDGALRRELEAGKDMKAMETGWSKGLEEYRNDREDCLIYE